MIIIGRGDRIDCPDFQEKGIFEYGEEGKCGRFAENGVLLTEREAKLLADFMHLNYRNVGSAGSFEEAEMWDLMGQELRRIVDEAGKKEDGESIVSKEDMAKIGISQ